MPSKTTSKIDKAAAAKIKDERGRPMTWDHMKSQKKRPVRTVTIPLDDELAAAWQDATGRYDLAKMRLEMGIEDDGIKKQVVEELAAAQARKDEIAEELEDNVAIFKVQGMGRRKYEELQNDMRFAPTQEQVDYNKKRNPGTTLPWNADTYPPYLIQRCLLEPQMTIAETKELWESDNWTAAELLTLLHACMEVNEQVRTVDWGKG